MLDCDSSAQLGFAGSIPVIHPRLTPTSQSRAVRSARWAHNPEVAGSNPASATVSFGAFELALDSPNLDRIMQMDCEDAQLTIANNCQ